MILSLNHKTAGFKIYIIAVNKIYICIYTYMDSIRYNPIQHTKVSKLMSQCDKDYVCKM